MKRIYFQKQHIFAKTGDIDGHVLWPCVCPGYTVSNREEHTAMPRDRVYVCGWFCSYTRACVQPHIREKSSKRDSVLSRAHLITSKLIICYILCLKHIQDILSSDKTQFTNIYISSISHIYTYNHIYTFMLRGHFRYQILTTLHLLTPSINIKQTFLTLSPKGIT